MIDRELLDILACPENKTAVSLADQALIAERKIDEGLIREDGAYLYRIEDGIPIMLIEEGIPLDDISSGA